MVSECVEVFKQREEGQPVMREGTCRLGHNVHADLNEGIDVKYSIQPSRDKLGHMWGQSDRTGD